MMEKLSVLGKALGESERENEKRRENVAQLEN